ncbi:hypothetical protein QBC42DRAFT_308172 [Cladorrhinum samala]|uniref:SET domain-containing protein n=1 Tax=Cladorrhinum samala TaxID=585594 RepID=A0AAV9HIV7_9PEZI|nr:hypothetical protein QBC42DRAFT_308172 [Cladorrhinum samala]
MWKPHTLLLIPILLSPISGFQIDAITAYNTSSPFPHLLPPDHLICPLPSSQNPWSLPPLCPPPRQSSSSSSSSSSSLNDDEEDDEDEDPSPDCIFTSQQFRSSQGLSVITSPYLASVLLPALSDTSLPPSLPPSPGPSRVPWKIQPLPGRGMGLVATSKIQKHSRIMLGYPVLVVRLDFINGGRYSSKKKREMLDEAVDRLGGGVKKKILGLARSGQNKGDGVILDVLKTNGFGIEVGGEQHLGLFIEGSRVNHNCRPNAFWRYVPSAMAMEVVALRNIQPGEEVAHSYAPLGYTHEERKAVLRQWGFQCRCALCSAPPAERELADSRRERILEIHQLLSKASDIQSSRRIDQLVKEATTLIELEELHPQLVEYYVQFAKAYMMINDLKNGRHYIKKADEMWLFYGGEEHENVEGMNELWATLEEAEREAEDD